MHSFLEFSVMYRVPSSLYEDAILTVQASLASYGDCAVSIHIQMLVILCTMRSFPWDFKYYSRTLRKEPFFFLNTFFYNCIVQMGFLPWKIQVAFPGKSQLQQGHAIQPRVHARCSSVSIIHRTLTWTTGSLTCAQMETHARGCMDTARESALKVDSGRKIPCHTTESNLHGWHPSLMIYWLSYIPTPVQNFEITEEVHLNKQR